MPSRASLYVILLTARDARADVVAGLDAGADDYLIKPFDLEELRARVQVGRRLVALQDRLADRVAELQEALTKVKQLNGLLPICAYCKRIRTDQNYWEQVEHYVAEHSEAQFSHGICPPASTRSAPRSTRSNSALAQAADRRRPSPGRGSAGAPRREERGGAARRRPRRRWSRRRRAPPSRARPAEPSGHRPAPENSAPNGAMPMNIIE